MPPQALERLSTGVHELDELLDGLQLGDNVIWYDDAGSLAWPFCRQFLEACRQAGRPIIYVTFDRSPKNLVSKLGDLAGYADLTILDCFTWGKGKAADVFMGFYHEQAPLLTCRVLPEKNPDHPEEFAADLYRLHGQMSGVVGYVFESLTGMQELIGDEDRLASFYAHTCPRLYELSALAYWVMEKKAHSDKVTTQINHTAQVLVDLSIKRGTTSLSVLKAENRHPPSVHKPHVYWTRDDQVVIEGFGSPSAPLELGSRIRSLRKRRGLSQADLARAVGVTASNISQVESNHIYPSVSALVRIAEVLAVEVSHFFPPTRKARQVVFPLAEAHPYALERGDGDACRALTLLPSLEGDERPEALRLELEPGARLEAPPLPAGEYQSLFVLEGAVRLSLDENEHAAVAGDAVDLGHGEVSYLFNPGDTPAALLWLRFKA